MLRVERDGLLVGLAIVCGRVQRRRGLPGRSRSLYLNCTGDPVLDDLTIEYNGLLAESGRADDVLRAATAHFAGLPRWDEIHLNGWDGGEPPPQAELSRQGLALVERSTRSCYRVDLAALRASGQGYIDALPRKIRYNVRRAVRCAEELGELALDVAAGPDESARFLAELSEMHHRSWSRRGQPGAFANPFFSAFHADLVARTDAGVVQLVRMRVGERPVGYIYNLVHRGRVYNYQSGFDFEAAQGAAWRPGVVCHAKTIEMNLASGLDVYDFMAGDHVYKKELGGAPTTMRWLTLQRPRLKFRVEALLRAWLAKSARPPAQDEPDASPAAAPA